MAEAAALQVLPVQDPPAQLPAHPALPHCESQMQNKNYTLVRQKCNISYFTDPTYPELFTTPSTYDSNPILKSGSN
jgi:hypothetical protein